MKKMTIIMLMFFVLAIMAGVLYLAYSSGNLTYVCDYKETKDSSFASSVIAKRLYSSNIDEKKMEELSKTLLTTAFSEEELLQAALKNGKPEFYPWFSFLVKKKQEGSKLYLEGRGGQTLFENQSASRFSVTNLRMEMTCEGISVNTNESSIYGAQLLGSELQKITPIISEDGSNLAVQINNNGAFEIVFEGTTGTITIQYIYDIIPTDGLFNKIVLEKQLLQITINVVTAADGTLSATYEIAEASKVSDLY